MTDARFLELDRLLDEAGRIFNPDSGLFEAIDATDEEADLDLEPASFFGALGITAAECAEYVQRKIQEYDAGFRNA